MPHRSIRLFLLLAICMVTNGCRRESISEPKRHYVIGFSQCTNDLWRQIMMIQMQAEAAKYPELSIVVSNAHNNTQLQIDQIREFIEAKVDLLIISPNESEPVTPIAVEAFDMGIPTIIWDRKIHSDHYTTCISADNYDIGRDVGRYINTLLPEGATILEITGLMSSSPAVERHKGFLAEASESYSVHTISGDWKPEVAKERIEAIGQYRNIDLIFAHNDDMALAAYDAINEADSLSAQRIKFIGIDALVGVDAVLDGRLQASFLYPTGGDKVMALAVLDGRLQASFLYPTGGDKVMAIARRILLGKRVEKSYQLQSALVDSHNAYTLKAQQEQIVSYQEQINKQKTVLEQYDRSVDNLKYSLWAVIMIALIAGGMGIYAIRLNLRLRRRNEILTAKNTEIEIATCELMDKHAQIENVTAHKLQFFTNITHEIRTPLTLILNPLDSIVKREKDPEIQRNIWTIQRNARHLLNVVNQILDFRKIENNKMMLTLKQVDIVQFTQEILSYFETYAETEKIVYKFRTDTPHQQLWIDTDKIEQVLLNLLSNAFKYSPKYGTILVSVTDNGPSVLIEVEDNGKGIDKESLPRIFDRFYALKNTSNYSTGIGLHLTREYVELHHGHITADSLPGAYTVFRVELFKGKSHFGENAAFDETLPTNYLADEVIDDNKVDALLAKKYDETIVIAEDDPEILAYLKDELSTNFRVIAVNNGYDAVKAVMDNEVSLILSDVLMPALNGFQLCSNIKSNIATCHIPIVLLTALSDDNQRIYGIAEGADEYIHKPFNMQYVRLKIIRIIEERRRLADTFAQKFGRLTRHEAANLPCVDDVFRDKLFDLIEAQHSDSNFKIELMSDMLGMSRILLYRKITSIFGMSPSDLLRNFRLQKAVQLLTDQRRNVSEVAYTVGFSSPAYFAKCFKSVYNMTPTEYMYRTRE